MPKLKVKMQSVADDVISFKTLLLLEFLSELGDPGFLYCIFVSYESIRSTWIVGPGVITA